MRSFVNTRKARALVGLLGCAALGFAAFAPAAQATTVMIVATPPIAAAIARIPCLDEASGLATHASSPMGSPRMAKSAAILGGQLSALDRMRMAQNGETGIALAQSPPPVNASIVPAAGGFGNVVQQPCQAALLGDAPASSLLQLQPIGSANFLASKRVRIGKTGFDSAWRRVRDEEVGGTFRQHFGNGKAPTLETLVQVNRWVNREIAYVDDRDLFRRADYWAGARRTLRLRKGDCEDIALAKMQLLAAAGISRDDMFLTIARDRVRNADHALLVVRMGGRFVVLDNTTDVLLDGAQTHDYAPLLSFNDRSAWLHGY